MIDRLKRIGLRFILMLGGEVLQSAFGFGLNVTLARILPVEEYGVFAIVVLLGGFGLIYMRALIGVPACTFIPQTRRPLFKRAFAVTFGSGAVVIALMGAGLVCCTLALWRPHVALTGGLFIGAWSLRSYLRMALFAQCRAGLATGSDFVFTVSATALCALLIYTGKTNGLLSNVFFALTLAHVAGGAAALLALGQPIRLSLRHSVRRRFLTLLPSMTWSIVSVTMANLQGQGAILLLAVVAGPAAYAPIAATMAFFSPLRLATSALANMIQPDVAIALARPQERNIRHIALWSTAAIIAVCGAYGLAMGVAFPSLARIAFSGRFGDAPLGMIAVNFWCIATAAVLYSVPKVILETAQDFRTTAFVALVGAIIGAPVVVTLLILTSPVCSLLGIFVSELAVFIGLWVYAIRWIHRRGDALDLPTVRHGRNDSRVAIAPMLEINSMQNSGADL